MVEGIARTGGTVYQPTARGTAHAGASIHLQYALKKAETQGLWAEDVQKLHQ